MGLIAVLGSNSFSGAHFVDYCLDMGHDVIGISRSSEPSSIFIPYKLNKRYAKFEFHKFDLNRNNEDVFALLKKRKPKYIVNFAAQGMVSQSWGAPEEWYETNFNSPALLVEKLKTEISIEKFVQISTPEVYGSCDESMKENTNYNPTTPYAISKASLDMCLMAYFKNYGFPVTWTRAANVYGPGQQLYRIIPKTIVSIKRGIKLPLEGGGESLRAFIHIKDVVNATYKTMTEAKSGEIFHLSNDSLVSIKSLVEIICEYMEVEFDGAVEIVGGRPTLDKAYILDSTKAAQDLNWAPSISLKEGISNVVDWVDRNFNEIMSIPLSYQHKS